MKKLKLAYLLCIGLLLPYISTSQVENAKISVDFKIKNFGITVNGTFDKVSISTDLTNQDIAQWNLAGNIDVSSISTNNKKRDSHLLEVDYFDVDAFPQIRLKSKNFEKISQNEYAVTVELTIKKTKKTFVIPITIVDTSEQLELNSDFEIDRRDFDVGDGSLVLSNTVKISVNYNLKH